MTTGTRKEQLRADIENLERILSAGATSTVIDGQTTVFDLDASRLRLRELKAELAKIEGRRSPRPFVGHFDISGG